MLALGQEVFLGRHAEPHRAARQLREQDRDGFRLAVVFRAVAGADIGHLDADQVFRVLENARQFLAQRERVLAAGPHLDHIAFITRDRDERFEMKMLIAREDESVFEHMIAIVE